MTWMIILLIRLFAYIPVTIGAPQVPATHISPQDTTADLNLYFDASRTRPGDGSPEHPYGRNSELADRILTGSETGQAIALWVTGDGRKNEAFEQGYGRIGRLPEGRKYRIRGYGDHAILNGAAHLTHFTSAGNNIWKASVPQIVRNVIIDDRRAPLSADSLTYSFDRWSAPFIVSDDPEGGIAGLKPDGYYNGCYADLKPQLYRPSRVQITGFTGASGRLRIDTVSVPESLSPNEQLNCRFRLYNHPDFLKAENDWAYDRDEKILYVYSSTNPNTSKKVEAVIADFGISIGSLYTSPIDSLLIQGITFRNFALDGLFLYGRMKNSTITQNTFVHCTRNAITFRGDLKEANNHSNDISYNTIKDVGASGIQVFRLSRSDIHHNTISTYDSDEHIGFYQVAETGISNLGDAIQINTFTGFTEIHCNVYENTIRMAQVNGITLNGRGNKAYRNTVSRTGRNGNDIGGIYVPGTYTTQTSLYQNKILDGGYNNAYTSITSNASHGIYIDALSTEATITENVVLNNEGGIYLSVGNDECVIENNILAGNQQQISVAHTFRNRINPADNLRIRFNRMAVMAPGQKFMYYNAPFDIREVPFEPGTIDHNTYYTLVSGAQFTPLLDGLPKVRMMDGVSLSQWRMLTASAFGTSFDAHSEEIFFSTPLFTLSGVSPLRTSFESADLTLVTHGKPGTYGQGNRSQAAVSLTSKPVIAPGEAIRVTFTASASQQGVTMDCRLYGGQAYLGETVHYTLDDQDRTFYFFWKNMTGQPMKAERLSFRMRGFDGTEESISIRQQDFHVARGIPGEPLTARLLSEETNSPPASVISTYLPKTTAKPWKPQVTTSHAPYLLLEIDE